MKRALKFRLLPRDAFHPRDTEVLVHGTRDKRASMERPAEAQNAPSCIC